MTKYIGPSESARRAADKLMWNPQIYWPQAELLCSTMYPHRPFLSPDISPSSSEGSPRFTGRENPACGAPLSTCSGHQRLQDAGNLKASYPSSQNIRPPGEVRVTATSQCRELLVCVAQFTTSRSREGKTRPRPGGLPGRGGESEGPGSPQVGIREGYAKIKGSLGLSPTSPPSARPSRGLPRLNCTSSVRQGLSRMTAWLDCSPGSPELVSPQEGTEQAAVLTLEPAWSQRKRLAGGRPLGHRWGF